MILDSLEISLSYLPNYTIFINSHSNFLLNFYTSQKSTLPLCGFNQFSLIILNILTLKVRLNCEYREGT